MNPVEASAQFMLGFQDATGLDPVQADEQWAWHSRQLSDSDRQAVEEVGYENGVKEGKAWKEMYGKEA